MNSLCQGQALPPPVINPSLSGIRNSDLMSNSSSSQKVTSKESVFPAAPPMNFNTDDSGRRVSPRHRNPVPTAPAVSDNTDMIIDDSVMDTIPDCATSTSEQEVAVPTSTLPDRFSAVVESIRSLRDERANEVAEAVMNIFAELYSSLRAESGSPSPTTTLESLATDISTIKSLMAEFAVPKPSPVLSFKTIVGQQGIGEVQYMNNWTGPKRAKIPHKPSNSPVTSIAAVSAKPKLRNPYAALDRSDPESAPSPLSEANAVGSLARPKHGRFSPHGLSNYGYQSPVRL